MDEFKAVKKNWKDIALVKLCVFFFALMVAKLWNPVLSLEWYWYGLLFVIFAIKPLYSIFSK
ncbi:MAG: hypothetical protein JW716_04570 [Candidatus Aenigmarchaeota archaeon]|nr:hypothetical protein [Candidatus Aenigmarchaeota archaeon]